MPWDFESERWCGPIADRDALCRAGYYGMRAKDFMREGYVDSPAIAALAAKFAAHEAFKAIPELR